MVDPELKRWATDRQSEYIDAVNEYGSGRKAATALGVTKSAINEALSVVKKKAALAGYSPDHDMTHTAPDLFVIKGVSTLYDADGNVKVQWVKSSLDEKGYADAVREWVESLADGIKGLSTPAPKPEYVDEDLLAVYPMGDPHFGLYAWAEETGEDFDLAEAERRTMAAIDRLVASSPPAGTGLILELGDFFHAENSRNQTPASGNPLDVDTRFAKVIQVGLRAMVYTIDRAKEKHEKVIVWIIPGNHDPHASLMLAMCLASYYHNDERVEVDTSPSLYRYLKFGTVLIGSTHGHGAKFNDLPLLMAADRPADWGATTFRVWYCGHIHHKTVKEHPGVEVETFNTLAANDAWHAMKGYRAKKNMKVIVHHKEFGEIERHTCALAMIKGDA